MLQQDRHQKLLRVAFVNTVPAIGGAEVNMVDMIRALRQVAVTDALVAVPPYGAFYAAYRTGDLALSGTTLESWNWRAPWRFVRGIVRFVSLLRSADADIIHINNHHRLSHTMTACRLLNRPAIAHIRVYPTLAWIKHNRPHLLRAAKIVAVSHSVKSRLIEGSIPADRIEMVYDGVDVSGYTADYRPLDLQRADARPTVGLVGRLIPLKGGIDFIQAAAEVRRTLPTAQFWMVGTGPSEFTDELKTLVRRLDLETCVSFLGFQTDMPQIMRQLDLLVVATYEPETGRGEAGSNVTLEAMAARTPVLARRVGGPTEFLRDGRGVLVDPHGVQPLVDGMLHALTMPADTRRAMVEAAYAAVRSEFTLDRQARALRRVYDEVLTT